MSEITLKISTELPMTEQGLHRLLSEYMSYIVHDMDAMPSGVSRDQFAVSVQVSMEVKK